MNGPGNFVTMNPQLGAKTVLVLNLEHIAQLQFRNDPFRVDGTEQPMGFGISNEAPAIADIARRGGQRYGFALRPNFSSSIAGDLGGYAPLGVPRVQAIHSGPMYHTSGDTLDTISTPAWSAPPVSMRTSSAKSRRQSEQPFSHDRGTPERACGSWNGVPRRPIGSIMRREHAMSNDVCSAGRRRARTAGRRRHSLRCGWAAERGVRRHVDSDDVDRCDAGHGRRCAFASLATCRRCGILSTCHRPWTRRHGCISRRAGSKHTARRRHRLAGRHQHGGSNRPALRMHRSRSRTTQSPGR